MCTYICNSTFVLICQLLYMKRMKMMALLNFGATSKFSSRSICKSQLPEREILMTCL